MTPHSLDSLLGAWVTFVAQVERGYADSIYEYRNDLALRDLLAEGIASARWKSPQGLADRVRAIDERFFACTGALVRPLSAGKTIEMQPWWFRAPRLLLPELLEDLQSEGLMPKRQLST